MVWEWCDEYLNSPWQKKRIPTPTLGPSSLTNTCSVHQCCTTPANVKTFSPVPHLRICVFSTRAPYLMWWELCPCFLGSWNSPAEGVFLSPFCHWKEARLGSSPGARALVSPTSRPLYLPLMALSPPPFFLWNPFFLPSSLFRELTFASADFWQFSFVTHVLLLTLGRTLHSGCGPPEEGGLYSQSQTLWQKLLLSVWALCPSGEAAEKHHWTLTCVPSAGTGVTIWMWLCTRR